MEVTIDTIMYEEGKGKDKIYSIRAVQIPNVVTQGKTEQEAKENLVEALELYFEEAPEEKKLLIEEIKEESPPKIGSIPMML